jgi:hypothetical protein
MVAECFNDFFINVAKDIWSGNTEFAIVLLSFLLLGLQLQV